MTTLTEPVGPQDHVQGSLDAPVMLVEYGDFQCSYCGAAHQVVKAVQDTLGDQIAFIFRHFPLSEIHPRAEPAAETAEAASETGQFWKMHDLLFEHQDHLETVDLIAYGAACGLDEQQVTSALDGAFAETIKQDFMSGVRSGVNGTPTFFINGQRYDGDLDQPHLEKAVKQAIK